MKRKHLIFLMIILLVSCSSLGKRTVAESEIVSKDIVVERGIEEVSSKFGEEVSRKNIGVYKRGYRNWKLVMYGTNNYYIVNVAEDGKIVSSSKEDYK
jgi:putative liporotein